MNTLGNRVKHARGKMTQAEFSRAISVRRGTISKIEKDMTKSLALDTALKIQKLTGFAASWLQTGKGPKEYTQLKDDQIARIVAKLEGLPDEARSKIENDIDYISSLQ